MRITISERPWARYLIFDLRASYQNIWRWDCVFIYWYRLSLYCTVIYWLRMCINHSTWWLPVGATPHTGVEPCVRPDCSGFPAHRNNKTSRVGEDWPQIHCAGMSARSPGWQGGAVQAPARPPRRWSGGCAPWIIVYEGRKSKRRIFRRCCDLLEFWRVYWNIHTKNNTAKYIQ